MYHIALVCSYHKAEEDNGSQWGAKPAILNHAVFKTCYVKINIKVTYFLLMQNYRASLGKIFCCWFFKKDHSFVMFE